MTLSKISAEEAEWKLMNMMLYPAMNKLTSYVPNRYMLVNVVARRARQIAENAENTGEHLTEKPGSRWISFWSTRNM